NNFLEAQVEHLTEQVSGREASAGVEWHGRLMTFQETAIAVANETNRALRNDLFQIRISMIQDLNDLRAERLSKLHEASRTMRLMDPRYHSQQGSSDQFTRTSKGSPQTQPDFTADNYASLYEDLLGLNFEDLERCCRALLARTEATYLSRLSAVLKSELGISLDEATRPDAVYFLHHSPQESWFPASGLLGVYRATMDGLGINTESQKNIIIDDEPRPRKNPRAFCAPIRIPDEIRLVIRPFGGQSD